ncbi:MAG: hypothetical protein RID53_35655 [Coleofasciculus sp. B1-GNL1-01]|uniref:hypothetical protein n=1 Tax=Coleofasciculus sp. B1-GNL1-01 TaxID=3068484 RepID=UPI0032F2B35A
MAQQEPQDARSAEAQLEGKSRFGYNGLEIPVNAPISPPPPPPIQRKEASEKLGNWRQKPAIPAANPVLNRLKLNQLQAKKFTSQQSIQRKENSEAEELQKPPEAGTVEQPQLLEQEAPKQIQGATEFGQIVQQQDDSSSAHGTEKAKESKRRISKEQAERINTVIAQVRKLISEEYLESQFNALDGNLPELIGECFKIHGHLMTFLLFSAARVCGENGLLSLDCYLALGLLAGELIAYYYCIKNKLNSKQLKLKTVEAYLDKIFYFHDEISRIQEDL